MKKQSCPVCNELSSQCLSCASYVVDGEHIYYNEIKDFGATKEHELQFIKHIDKHSVTAFFNKGKLYIPSRQGRSVPLAIGLQWDVWQEQQAIIDDLIYKAKLRESDHQALLVKYQATKKCWEDMGKECESLKAQLNNMEQCYIQLKQEHNELIAFNTEIDRKQKSAEKTTEKYKFKVSMIGNLLRDSTDQDMTLKAIRKVVDRVGEHG